MFRVWISICHLLGIPFYLLGIRFIHNCLYQGYGHLGGEIAYLYTKHKCNQFPGAKRFWLLQKDAASNEYLLQQWVLSGIVTTIKNPILIRLLKGFENVSYLQINVGNGPSDIDPSWNLAESQEETQKKIINTVYPRIKEHHQSYLKASKDGLYPLLHIPKSDIHFGYQELNKIGIGEDTFFVCIHAREDSTYDKYRSSSITKFAKTAEFIRSLGGTPIRIGTRRNPPLDEDIGIIDYPHSPIVSYQMDIFLLSQQKFFLGCQSGPLAIVQSLFNKPIGMFDAPVWSQPTLFSNSLYLFKMIINEQGELLSLEDYFNAQMHYLACGNSLPAKLTFIENSEDDILGLTEDLYKLNFSNQKRPFNLESDPIQQAWKNRFPSDHLSHYTESWISPSFLEKYKNHLFPEKETT
jgi:putative glycosyltransferase (TIGR04372 family)